MFHWIYVSKIHELTIIAVIAVIVANIVFCLLPPKLRRVMGFAGVCVCVIAIVEITLLNRATGSVREFILMPGSFLIEAKTNPEIYRSMYMNSLLFVPLGVCVPHMFNTWSIRKYLYSACAVLLVVIIIEVIQYALGLGRAEADDVLFNTIGYLVGASFSSTAIKIKHLKNPKSR